MITLHPDEFPTRISKLFPEGREVLVVSRTNSNSRSWYGYWKGVDILVGSLEIHIMDFEAPYNGYGGWDVTGSHHRTLKWVKKIIRDHKCSVVE